MNQPTFETRLAELKNGINPKVLPEEVEALVGSLAALEALVAHRIAVEWISAGGQRAAFPNVTDQQIADARKWRAANLLRLNAERSRFYCSKGSK